MQKQKSSPKNFFSNKPKKEKKGKFIGNRSVNIRELVVSKDYWLWVSIGFSSLLVVYFSLQIGSSFQNWEKIRNDREQVASKINLWQGIISQYPNYTDAYFETAVLSYQLGNVQHVYDLLQKLSLIDQNFPYAKKLELLTGIESRR